eukprot:gene5873-6468_t
MTTTSTTTTTTHTNEIDESLYSRQLYVMGHEAQKRMASSSVLLVGLNGLGVEVAKNIILAGVKSVTLLDDEKAIWEDLSAQFYLDESSLGHARGEISLPKLAELNPYVHVTCVRGNILDILQGGQYTVVVLINQNFTIQSQVGDYCHSHDIAFIAGASHGVCGQIFCDFGNDFIIHDPDGEPAASSIIAGITRDQNALVTVLEETRHNLNTGDVVKITGVSGMTEINDQLYTITVKDPFSFELNHDSRSYGAYERGGYVQMIKQPTHMSFQSISQSFVQPGMFCCDVVKYDRAAVLHLAFRALHGFVEKHGILPRPGNTDDAQEVVDLVQHFNETVLQLSPEFLSANEEVIRNFAKTSRGQLSPICAFLGGALGQEVLKACSGKFTPINQWFYYDCLEALPKPSLPVEEVQPIGSRYDGQLIVFGHSIQKALANLRLFLVGAGAIGCEMLKNWAMMGVGTGEQGLVQVTDMDQIEKSNLSRQFLFRNTDILKLKATTAVEAVKRMNPSFQARAYEHKVANETEHIFNDDFFEALDMVCTALDNVEARLYLDQKCVFYRKPMLESGTLGTKGHTQIISPGQTENYGATRDPPEKTIPVCTLKHFPNLIEHTLQWAREWFEEVYKQGPDEANGYLNDESFLNQLAAQPNLKMDTLKRIESLLVSRKAVIIDDCIVWAREAFEDLFSNRIKQLLHNFPLDRLTSSGTPFWSGAKKPPTPLLFDASDPSHLDFIEAVANLRADVFRLPHCEDRSYLAEVARRTTVAPFQPADGVKIAATDEEAKADSEGQRQASSVTDLDSACDNIVRKLPQRDSLRGFTLSAMDFDKDVDAHMRVVAAVGNLRARNYRIPEADLHTSRGIAGKITPAISTSTALVTGAICMEIYKLLQKKEVEVLANSFINLALPLFTSMQPEPPKTTKSIVKGKEWCWTQWDCIDIKEELTVSQLMDFLSDSYGLELCMLSSGVTILFSDFMDRKKTAERKNMNLKTLFETVTKKQVHPGQRYLIFELIVNDLDSGDEVEVPYLRYRL